MNGEQFALSTIEVVVVALVGICIILFLYTIVEGVDVPDPGVLIYFVEFTFNVNDIVVPTGTAGVTLTPHVEI